MKKDLFSKNITKILSLTKSKTFNASQINALCNELKEKRYIAQSMSHDAFIKRLIDLQTKQVNITMNDKYLSVYAYDEDISEYRMLLGYRKNSFYSMSTALNIAGLGDFRNNFIFISQELSKKNVSGINNPLSQESIDNAFKKSYRRTHMTGKYEDRHIVFLSPKYTDCYEVITNNDGIRLSSVNRALVEMIVNVQYFKNSQHIVDVFKPLKDKLDIHVIYNVVDKFDFIYPYFQSVGFYLYQIGFKEDQLKKFKNKVGELKFYTDKEQENYYYNDYWKMYYI